MSESFFSCCILFNVYCFIYSLLSYSLLSALDFLVFLFFLPLHLRFCFIPFALFAGWLRPGEKHHLGEAFLGRGQGKKCVSGCTGGGIRRTDMDGDKRTQHNTTHTHAHTTTRQIAQVRPDEDRSFLLRNITITTTPTILLSLPSGRRYRKRQSRACPRVGETEAGCTEEDDARQIKKKKTHS
ncbi:hypothetical protein DFH27DRAFT_17359 [Peziza echinospora]|nr:hypothetical protein DFH27DRAFT_17359 [Peziza echinospora]